MKSLKQTNPNAGFTLIELLVALMIFAILAAAGWQVFAQLQQTRKNVSARAEKISKLQFAYLQISKDITQLVNQPAVLINNQLISNQKQTDNNRVASLLLTTKQLSFTRLANFDPRYIGAQNALKLSRYERVSYILKDNKLLRLSSKRINDANATPLASVLLDNVTNLRFTAFDPASINLWPPIDDELAAFNESNLLNVNNQDNQSNQDNVYQGLTQKPQGISIDFDYMDIPIEWRFSITASLPKDDPPQTKKLKTKKSQPTK